MFSPSPAEKIRQKELTSQQQLSPRGVVPSEADDALHPSYKPFFIMDFLEEVDEKDVDRVRKVLQTPQKLKRKFNIDEGDLDSVRRQIFGASNAGRTPPRHPSTNPPTKQMINSPFRKRGIAVGNGWNSKGLHRAKAGDWAGALICWENAAEVRTQVLGRDHLDVANTYNNIGIALGKLSRFDEALGYLDQALFIRTQTYGSYHEEVAATLHNIGNVLQEAENLEAAVQVFFHSMKIQEHLYGRNHIQVARACIAIGHIYHEATQYLDARDAYVDALDILARAGVPKNDAEYKGTKLDLMDIEKLIHDLDFN